MCSSDPTGITGCSARLRRVVPVGRRALRVAPPIHQVGRAFVCAGGVLVGEGGSFVLLDGQLVRHRGRRCGLGQAYGCFFGAVDRMHPVAVKLRDARRGRVLAPARSGRALLGADGRLAGRAGKLLIARCFASHRFVGHDDGQRVAAPGGRDIGNRARHDCGQLRGGFID